MTEHVPPCSLINENALRLNRRAFGWWWVANLLCQGGGDGFFELRRGGFGGEAFPGVSDFAVFADQDELRDAGYAVIFEGFAVVEHEGVAVVVILLVLGDGVGGGVLFPVTITGDSNHAEALGPILLVESLEGRAGGFTGAAPGGPEIEHDDFAFKVFRREFCSFGRGPGNNGSGLAFEGVSFVEFLLTGGSDGQGSDHYGCGGHHSRSR